MLKIIVGAALGKGHVINVLFTDGIYSSNGSWIVLSRENRIEFVTSFKSNTGPTNNGYLARGKAVEL